MAVGETFKGDIHPIPGVRLAAVESGIRYRNRLDLVLIEIAAGSSVAGVFTQNAFCAAPVSVARKNLDARDSRYFLINTGNANAGTGEQGALDALRCCQSLADIASVDISEVLPFSTGVIGERLPVEKIIAGIPDAFTSLDESAWEQAARGIMTTDTRPKLVSRQIDVEGKSVSITGIAKGAGLRCIKGCDVRKFLVALTVELPGHGGNDARAIANVNKLLVEVLLALASQFRERRHAIAIRPVTGAADRDVFLTFGRVALGHIVGCKTGGGPAQS